MGVATASQTAPGPGFEWAPCDQLALGRHLPIEPVLVFCPDCGEHMHVLSPTVCALLKEHRHAGCHPYNADSGCVSGQRHCVVPYAPMPELKRRFDFVHGQNGELAAKVDELRKQRNLCREKAIEGISAKESLKTAATELQETKERLARAERDAAAEQQRAAELDAECRRLKSERKRSPPEGGGQTAPLVQALQRLVKGSKRKRRFLAMLHPDQLGSESLCAHAKIIREAVGL